MRIVVALGGNALLRRGELPESEVQRRRVRPVARAVAALAADHEVLVVHGNGPQVGLLALETEADPRLSRPFPLGDLVAESQGLIGSWIQQELLSHDCPAAALVTQVVVDGDDPAFSDPAKPIGGTYDEATARRLAQQRGWAVRPDGDEWRRVVPSPRPLEVVDLAAARVLVQAGRVVVVGGGGGVPVLREGRAYVPVEAVVDKDLVAGLVADGVAADLLVVLTDVEGVIDGFGTPQAQVMSRATPEELRSRRFAAGSMGPKVEACARFVQGRPERRAVIAALESLAEAVAGAVGTQIVDSASRG